MKQIILALAILLAAVSCKEGLIETPVEQETETTYELAVKADKGESPVTKALSIETNAQGKHVLNASWETSDIVSAVRSNQVIGTLSPKTSGSSAILAGTVTGELRKGYTIYLYYPRDGNSSDYTGQDGKLETIASRYDYIYGSTEITSIENRNITCTPVTFNNSQAIVKFILKDGSGNPVYPDRLVLSAFDGSGNSMLFTANDSRGQLAVNIDQGEEATNEVYVAIKQWSDASVFRIEAYVNEDAGYVYRIVKRSTTYFTEGEYYEVTVNLGTKEADTAYTLDSFSFDFDFGESAREWPIFVFFDDITTGYWYDADGSGAGAGSFIDLGGTIAGDLAHVKKVTAVSMPHWTNQTPVYSMGRWTFGNIEGWEYIAHGKVGCEYTLVEGTPHLSADITLADPEVTGKEIRVYNNATNTRVAYNNLIPMGLAYISSDGTISEVNPDAGGWISLVRSGDSESTTTYGYAKEVASPTSFGYLALERNNNGTKTYYHQFYTDIEEPGHHPLNDYSNYSVVQDNNGLYWVQVGPGYNVTFNGTNWWTTNLSSDINTPDPHPWTGTTHYWRRDNSYNHQGSYTGRKLSDQVFSSSSIGDSCMPSTNQATALAEATNVYFTRIAGVDGAVLVDKSNTGHLLFLSCISDPNYYYRYLDEPFNPDFNYWLKEYFGPYNHIDIDGEYGNVHKQQYWEVNTLFLNRDETSASIAFFPDSPIWYDNGWYDVVEVRFPVRPVKK